MQRFLIALMIVAFTSNGAYSQSWEELPQYVGDHKLSGELRNYGFEGLFDVVKFWEAGFRKQQRFVQYVDTSGSPAVAIGGLYTGVADIAVMGRIIWPVEVQAFHKVFGYEPLGIEVAGGSFDVQGKNFGMVIFVNKQNPITKLTFRQLDGIFGEARNGGWQGMSWSPTAARSANENIRTWGQLGLTGEWADKPIHVYGNDLTLNLGSMTFQSQVMQGGDKWNPAVVEFPLSEPGTGGPPPVTRGGDRQMEALAADPYGIAITGMHLGRKSAQAKALALAAKDGGPYFEPTKETFINRTYPLAQSMWVYINRAPGKPVEPKVKEFLKFILSREGQRIVSQDDGILPLPPNVVREQLKKLE